MEGAMHKYRITYMRSSYMEMEITAKSSRDAEARFNMLAASRSLACEWGDGLTAPRYRIVDVTSLDPADRAQRAGAAASGDRIMLDLQQAPGNLPLPHPRSAGAASREG
jgi:hypothetical protein